MNKIISIPFILVLSGCSTSQIKTSEVPVQPHAVHQQVSVAKPSLPHNVYMPPVSRQHTVISSINPSSEIKTGTDELNKVDSAEYESFLPRIASYIKKGVASWYGPGFHGRKTATGEVFDMYEMTAAHKTLPIPSYAQVTNLENNKTVVVRINDRGPFVGNRLLDLSYAAAKKLGIQQEGTGKVEIKAITPLQALPQIQKTAESQNKKVYLEVGNFGSQRKALKLQDKIASHNLPEPTIIASTHRSSKSYKVQMGPIKSSDGAKNLSYQLAKLGIKDPQFVTASREN